MNKLFLICFECQIEPVIREKFGDNSFFLTNLGNVIHMGEFDYAERINQFLMNKEINTIYLVNDTSCTIFRNCFTNEIDFSNHSIEAIKNTFLENYNEINCAKTPDDKLKILAQKNIDKQAKELLSSAFIGNKKLDGKIAFKGLIYDRENKEFEEYVI